MINEAIRFLMNRPGCPVLPGDIAKITRRDVDNILILLEGGSIRKIQKKPDGKLVYLTGGSVSELLIRYAVEGIHLGSQVLAYAETASTNDIAWSYASDLANSGLVVFAESQTAGRGRFIDRKWHDSPGSSILMSVLLKGGVVSPDVLGIAAAVAVAGSIRDICQLEAAIKWPNDIVFGTKKLAGIMVEARKVDGLDWFVLGVGINCNQEQADFVPEIDQRATSIAIETGIKVDRDLLLINILDKLDNILVGGDDRQGLAKKWLEFSSKSYANIIIQENGIKYEGTVVEVEPFQGVTLKLADGSIRFFDARTASVVAF